MGIVLLEKRNRIFLWLPDYLWHKSYKMRGITVSESGTFSNLSEMCLGACNFLLCCGTATVAENASWGISSFGCQLGHVVINGEKLLLLSVYSIN